LRKLLMGAIAASATLAVAAGATAQTPEATLKASASPNDAGTTSNPKNTKLGFDLTVNKPGTTVQTITLKLPTQIKLSGKGLGRCNFDDLNAEGPTGCPSKSKAGPVGEAHAVAGPALAPVDFTVYPFVEDSNTLLFYLNSTLGVQQAIRGEITSQGHKLTITIPTALRKPGGLDASLTGLKQSFGAKVGSRYLVSSTGCKNRKWNFSGTLGFASDRVDGAPAPAPLTSTTSVRCKK
jgi:hypothetical protein